MGTCNSWWIGMLHPRPTQYGCGHAIRMGAGRLRDRLRDLRFSSVGLETAWAPASRVAGFGEAGAGRMTGHKAGFGCVPATAGGPARQPCRGSSRTVRPSTGLPEPGLKKSVGLSARRAAGSARPPRPVPAPPGPPHGAAVRDLPGTAGHFSLRPSRGEAPTACKASCRALPEPQGRSSLKWRAHWQ
jgi:hypothetical protein